MRYIPTEEKRDEALTTCIEMLLGATRSDAQGILDAKSDDLKYHVQLQIQGVLEQSLDIPKLVCPE
jgi:hypothetical protein